jgi:hypothetical protein
MYVNRKMISVEKFQEWRERKWWRRMVEGGEFKYNMFDIL